MLYVASDNLIWLLGLFDEDQQAYIAAPTITQGGSAGTTVYFYQVIAKTSAGTTTQGNPSQPASINAPGSFIGVTVTGNATLSGGNFNTITWSAASFASTYDVVKWNGTAWALVGNTSGTTLNDIGQGGSLYAVPQINTAAFVDNATVVGQVTTMSGQNVGSQVTLSNVPGQVSVPLDNGETFTSVDGNYKGQLPASTPLVDGVNYYLVVTATSGSNVRTFRGDIPAGYSAT